ncbi:major royal jelly protein 1-like [Neodiprion pinetum]|uniref:major royal jelly protein 1-like n=1 Tax=Neodiprion pinetum TaxID=441929 RepID=UPI001EDE5048|nr:major royal jelly protein 1-like [Neodiprion pinetum]
MIFRLSFFWRILPIVLGCTAWSSAAKLKTVYEWKYIDYVWNDNVQKLNAIKNGQYNHTKIIPIDFQKISGGRVLVTTPRLFNNPASLSTVSNQTGDGGPLLEPYPNWDWHTSTDCTGITSVNRIFLDECNRLWIVDSGKIGNVQTCPAQIIAFNPETDEVLQRVIIPDELTHSSVNTNNGRLEIQTVETHGDSCSTTWVYIGDPEGYGLVIWNGSTIWRLEDDNVYAPDPEATIFSVDGENVTLELGVSSLVIPPPGFIEEGYLLFKPLASRIGYSVTLDDLHNSNTAGNTVTYYRSNFTIPSQELARVYSKFGVLIGGFATQLVVACWNIQYPLTSESVGTILEDDNALQFTSAAKITNGCRDEFEYEHYWLLTNRLQEFVLGIMDFNEVNYRILGANLAALVRGTVCEPEPHTVSPSIEDKFFFEFETVTVVSSAITASEYLN